MPRDMKSVTSRRKKKIIRRIYENRKESLNNRDDAEL
jgi:hypothetical protein